MNSTLQQAMAIRTHAVLTWGWLIVALPFVTDAACNIFLVFLFSLAWLALAATWLAFAPSLRRFNGWPDLRWWLSAGMAGLVGLVLAFTDIGLMARIALCEPALVRHAEDVRTAGGNDAVHGFRPVGLFLVDGEEYVDGVLFLYTSHGFIDREGIAYFPAEKGKPPNVSRRRMRHLYGSWYWFYKKF